MKHRDLLMRKVILLTRRYLKVETPERRELLERTIRELDAAEASLLADSLMYHGGFEGSRK